MTRRKSLVGFSLAAVAALVPASAGAQNVDIVTQNITVDLTSDNHTVVEIEATLQATGTSPYLYTYLPGMPVTSVDIDGIATYVEPHPSYPDMVSVVHYPVPLTAGDQAVAKMVLSGTPDCSSSYYPSMVACKRSADETIFPPGRPGNAWYFMNVYDVDTFTGQVQVKAPAAHTVVAGQGPAVEIDDSQPGLKTWTFDYTTPVELLGLYAGTAATVSSSDGYPVLGVFQNNGANEANMSAAVDLASRVLPVYGQLYSPVPVERANIIVVPSNFEFGGMGLLGTIFLSDVVLDQADFMLEQGIAHEFGHTWWGNSASGAIYEEGPFLSEGFTEYSAWRALGQVQQPQVRTAGMRMNAVWYMYRRPNDVDAPIIDPNTYGSPAYVFVTYHKGPLVLRHLEQVVGADAFGQALQTFLARGAGGLSIAAFEQDVLAAGGVDISAEVQQWLYATGYPRFTVSSQLNGVADGVDVALQVITDGAFELPVPVRFTFSDGTTLDDKLQLSPGETNHDFSLTERPVAIEIDPDWTLVREVNLVAPTDVNFDNTVDAADLMEVALRNGAYLPTTRRMDGSYDPLYDINRDRVVDDLDLNEVIAATAGAE